MFFLDMHLTAVYILVALVSLLQLSVALSTVAASILSKKVTNQTEAVIIPSLNAQHWLMSMRTLGMDGGTSCKIIVHHMWIPLINLHLTQNAWQNFSFSTGTMITTSTTATTYMPLPSSQSIAQNGDASTTIVFFCIFVMLRTHRQKTMISPCFDRKIGEILCNMQVIFLLFCF